MLMPRKGKPAIFWMSFVFSYMWFFYFLGFTAIFFIAVQLRARWAANPDRQQFPLPVRAVLRDRLDFRHSAPARRVMMRCIWEFLSRSGKFSRTIVCRMSML